MNFCVIIPAYNEEATVGAVVADVIRLCSDVFVVDDGSTDRTALVAEEAGAVVIKLTKNRGKGFAIRKGLELATERGFQAAVAMDADCQHSAAEVPQLLAPILDGDADIVIGSRARARGFTNMPIHRQFTNKLMTAVIRIFACRNIRDTQSGFRAFRIAAVGQLSLRQSRFDFESEIILEAARRGLTIIEVATSTRYALHRKSKINAAFETFRFIKLMLRYLLS